MRSEWAIKNRYISPGTTALFLLPMMLRVWYCLWIELNVFLSSQLLLQAPFSLWVQDLATSITPYFWNLELRLKISLYFTGGDAILTFARMHFSLF